MTRRKRIAKRTASILLCVVLLSLNLPCFIPPASANVVPPPDLTVEDLQIIVVDLKGILEAYARLGAIKDVLGKGVLTGEALEIAKAELQKVQNHVNVMEQSSNLLRKLRDVAGGAATSVGAMLASLQLSAGAVLGGFGIVVTDWGAMYNLLFNPQEYWANYIEMDNFLYNTIVNDTHLDSFVTWLVNITGGIMGVDVSDFNYVEMTKRGLQDINNWFDRILRGVYNSIQPGMQQLPAVSYQQVLNMMDARLMEANQSWDLYELPFGTVGNGVDAYGASGAYIRNFLDTDGKEKVHAKNQNNQIMNSNRIIMYVQHKADYIPGYNVVMRPGTFSFVNDIWTFRGSVNGSADVYTSKSALGIPATDYINRIDELADAINRLADEVHRIQLPTIEPSGDPHIDFWRWWEEMQNYDPVVELETLTETDTGTDPGTDPGTGTGTDTDTDPDDDDDDPPDLPKSPDVTRKFPFCVPFDLIACLTLLNAQAEAPRFEIPLELPAIGFRYDFVIDFSEFELLAQIVRWFMLAIFVVGLVMMTRNMIRG